MTKVSLDKVKTSHRILVDRGKAINQSWNSKVRGLYRCGNNIEQTVAYAGIDDAHIWLGLKEPRRTNKLSTEVASLISRWKERLHQGTEWGMLHDMAWEFGEKLAKKKKR